MHARGRDPVAVHNNVHNKSDEESIDIRDVSAVTYGMALIVSTR